MSKWAAREDARVETGVWILFMRPLDLISVTACGCEARFVVGSGGAGGW